jgi:hypothetical protein
VAATSYGSSLGLSPATTAIHQLTQARAILHANRFIHHRKTPSSPISDCSKTFFSSLPKPSNSSHLARLSKLIFVIFLAEHPAPSLSLWFPSGNSPLSSTESASKALPVVLSISKFDQRSLAQSLANGIRQIFREIQCSKDFTPNWNYWAPRLRPHRVNPRSGECENGSASVERGI